MIFCVFARQYLLRCRAIATHQPPSDSLLLIDHRLTVRASPLLPALVQLSQTQITLSHFSSSSQFPVVPMTGPSIPLPLVWFVPRPTPTFILPKSKTLVASPVYLPSVWSGAFVTPSPGSTRVERMISNSCTTMIQSK